MPLGAGRFTGSRTITMPAPPLPPLRSAPVPPPPRLCHHTRPLPPAGERRPHRSCDPCSPRTHERKIQPGQTDVAVEMTGAGPGGSAINPAASRARKREDWKVGNMEQSKRGRRPSLETFEFRSTLACRVSMAVSPLCHPWPGPCRRESRHRSRQIPRLPSRPLRLHAA